MQIYLTKDNLMSTSKQLREAFQNRIPVSALFVAVLRERGWCYMYNIPVAVIISHYLQEELRQVD